MSDQSGRDDAEFEIMNRAVRGNLNQDDKAKLFTLNKIVDTGIDAYQKPTPEPMEDTK